jgi:hypothetical protein
LPVNKWNHLADDPGFVVIPVNVQSQISVNNFREFMLAVKGADFRDLAGAFTVPRIQAL